MNIDENEAIARSYIVQSLNLQWYFKLFFIKYATYRVILQLQWLPGKNQIQVHISCAKFRIPPQDVHQQSQFYQFFIVL